ncbi:guanylate cyclase 32E [Clonorchis sinensis]|uniref:Guanylate cyclase n=1 Tax=Clonorchis sinensis TaxID=79923 RepID=G7Y6E9_CLOSI|nr:guanylate cyclase 32E [Clonorchis sinensis]
MAVFTSNAQRRQARRMLTLPSDKSVTNVSGTDPVTLSDSVLGDVSSPRHHSIASSSLQVKELDSEKHQESTEHHKNWNTSSGAFFSFPTKQERHPLLFVPTVLPPECTEARLGGGLCSWTTPSTVRGTYRKKPVAVHRLNIRLVNINREVKTSLKLLRDISHSNLCQFVGACVEQDHVCVLWDYMPRGSLRDIFQPDRPKLKPIFLTSLTLDLIRGLTFLHESDLRYHGNLKSTNCLIDSRWMLKLTDFGLTAFRVGESFAHLDDNAYFSRLIWTSPELLRRTLALLVSGQLCAFSHPQLALLTEQLVSQGITFTLNHCRRTTDGESEVVKNARNSESPTFLGTQAGYPADHGPNNKNVQFQTGFTSRDKELITHGQKESDLSTVSSESRRYVLSNRLVRRRHLSQSGLPLQTDHKCAVETHEHRRFSQVDSYLPSVERTESDSGRINVLDQKWRPELSVRADWKEHRTKRRPVQPPKNGCSPSIVERKPKLSTILIHPEGASFVDQSVNDYRNHGDHCEQLSSGSHTNLHSPFHRPRKVHHKSPDRSSRRRRRAILGLDWFYKQCNSRRCRRKPLGFSARHSKNPSNPFRNSTSILEPSMAWRFFTHKQNAVQLPEVRDPIGSMQMADIYALGMVLFELYYQNDPYKHNRHKPKEIIRRVIVLNDEFKIPYRPNLSQLSREEKYVTDCIEACWAENPLDRPTIKQVAARLRPVSSGRHTNIMDNLMSLMEEYAVELEKLVAARSAELMEEKSRTEQLLYQMLPEPVAEQLKRGKLVEPEAFDSVTIYFSDICGFTEWSSTASAFEVVSLLNELYTRFDAVLSSYDVYKVETIGDAYMVVSGLPKRNENHAGEIASMSLRLLQDIKENFTLSLRIGIHSGPCAAGVVGTKMPRYCLFGDTVNTASRMESHGEPCRIHCSEQCKQQLDRLGVYVLQERGLISIKGKGMVRTYWLLHKTKPSLTARKFLPRPAPYEGRNLWNPVFQDAGCSQTPEDPDAPRSFGSGGPAERKSESDDTNLIVNAFAHPTTSLGSTDINRTRLSRPSWFARTLSASTERYFGCSRDRTIVDKGRDSPLSRLGIDAVHTHLHARNGHTDR